jgi:hypothetical protein
LIPQAYIQAWRAHAPWPNPAQVEQDLIICRALCDLFNAPALAGKIAFRGGTAIHKLLFKQPLLYSEDIDLVQTQSEPIGPTLDAIRDTLAWLGKCNREQAGHSMHLVFRFAPESAPQATLKLKVEINTREHEALFGCRSYPFAMSSDWYSTLKIIDDFFVGQNLTLAPGRTWREVSANIFSVVNGKKILFESADGLFQQLRAAEPSVSLIREAVALGMTADEIHQDVHEFIAKMKAMTGGEPRGSGT